MISNKHILNYKFIDVINEYAKENNIPLRTALELFYNSNVYEEIRDGVSDMHCRSDGYLAEELSRELKVKG
ncbi:hypothetical protein FACS1894137_00430 [Spirochaetia bacterium]|nr:hypothetical protein FACS1894137_00430 [Spirochaetia bacterium]